MLTWIWFNQDTIPAHLYSGREDASTAQDARDPMNDGVLGRVMFLSSYVGGERYMQGLFQNTTAIVNRFGKPTLFVTMNGNPIREEIT